MSESWATSAATRKAMQGNRSRDTKPELEVRRILHSRGLRYFVSRRPLSHSRRTADLLFSKAKVAVFIDGCFWHGCPEHYRQPSANRTYWLDKVARNMARDVETTKQLEHAGWTVLRFWSHETPLSVADRIQILVQRQNDLQHRPE